MQLTFSFARIANICGRTEAPESFAAVVVAGSTVETLVRSAPTIRCNNSNNAFLESNLKEIEMFVVMQIQQSVRPGLFLSDTRATPN